MHRSTRSTAIRTIRLLESSIEVVLYEGGTCTITSNLRDEIDERAADAIESLILALACGGVEIGDPAYIAGIITAVEAIANNADTDD